MHNNLTDIDISLMKKFVNDKENSPKIMVGDMIFYPYTTKKTDIVTYNNFLIAKDKFEYKYQNQHYLHCRIFTVENFLLALDMMDKADDFFVFRYEKNILEKYTVIEQEIFVLYSNPYIADIIRHLSIFEFVNGLEDDGKMKFIFDEYTRYIAYAQNNFKECLNFGI